MGYWVAAAALAGSAVSSYGASKSNSDSAEQRDAAYQAGIDAIDRLKTQSTSGNFYGYGLEDIFGSKVDPSAALYDPVNITQSQKEAIAGNIDNFAAARDLSIITNDATITNDLARMNRLFPKFDQNLDQFSGITASLLNGQNPFGNEDVLGIVSDRSSLAGALGTPGGSGPTTNKDLGLTRMNLAQQGASMFQDFIRTADAISPLNSQFRAQQSYLTPSERLDADIRQRENEQQGRLSAAYLEASPDPAAAGLFNLDYTSQVGLASAKLGSAVNLQNPYAALGQGISQAGAAYGQYQQRNAAQGYGGGQYNQSPYAAGYTQQANGSYVPKAQVVN